MRIRRNLLMSIGCVVVLSAATALGNANASAFTYQGLLKEGGMPVNGTYDLVFRLYAQPEGGEPILLPDGDGVFLYGQTIMAGLFQADLDFGADVLRGHDELWLEVGVRPGMGRGSSFTILSPRQRLGAAPGAIVADYAESTKGGALSFAGSGETSIGLDPAASGLVAKDPTGMRIMNMTAPGVCAISGEPCRLNRDCPLDETCDPCEDCEPIWSGGAALYFGPNNSTRVGTDPGTDGLVITDNDGIRLLLGTHICSEAYPPYDEVHYCELDSDCYGCCTPLSHCTGSGTPCTTDEDCAIGACNDSGEPCRIDRDCEPGACSWTLGPCYSDGVCLGGSGDRCINPPPEGCSGGEVCQEDWPCTTRCYGDEDCPEGSICDWPVPGECVVPEGRCSDSDFPCYADTDCNPGYCQDKPELECWDDGHCYTSGGFLSIWYHGPCIGAASCIYPIHAGPLAVHFGKTDDHAIGLDPGVGGLVAMDPDGLHVVSPEKTCSGTGQACNTDEDCPEGGCSNDKYPCRNDDICGHPYTCTNPPPETCESGVAAVKVYFGASDETSIGSDSSLGGLVLNDPYGIRLTGGFMASGQSDEGIFDSAKLFFGPTDSTFVGTETSTSGLVLNSPGGARLATPVPEPPPRLYFGPTDDCSIGLDAVHPGMIVVDPDGLRILNPVDNVENVLIFGIRPAGAAPGVMEPRIDTGVATDGMRFYAPSFFFDGGPVGIGVSRAQAAALHVEGRIPALVDAPVVVIDRRDSDGVAIDFRRDGASVGDIYVDTRGVSYNGFTGSHLAWTDETMERGTLVRFTGVNRRLHGNRESEMVYGITPVSKANDPRCLGAYLGARQTNESQKGAETHLVMAVGNGSMWVTDAKGDIEPGDYLVSSDVAGCAMKDDPLRFPIGHIVARAAEGVRWGAVSPDGSGVRRTRISVFFESFVRDSDVSGLAGEVARLTSLVESQRREIHALRETVDSMRGLASRLSRLERSTAHGDEPRDVGAGQ